MTTELTVAAPAPLSIDDSTLTAVVTDGDCSKLNEAQRRQYYLARCEAAGLDPRTAPFMFTRLNNKLVLYALKGASDQLASKHGVQTTILSKDTVEGVLVVTVRATARDGRMTEDVGAVLVGGKKGDDLANAIMKAVTKAKRRAILSLCGLGMLDETELDTIPGAKPAAVRVIKDEEAPTKEPPVPMPAEWMRQQPDAVPAATTFDALMAECAKGWDNWTQKRAWAEAHHADKESLTPEQQKALTEAFKAARPATKESK